MTQRVQIPVNQSQAEAPVQSLKTEIEQLRSALKSREAELANLRNQHEQERHSNAQLIEQRLQAAQEEGLATGIEQGITLGRQALDQLHDAVQSSQAAVEAELGMLQSNLHKLVMVALYKILGEQLVRPEVVAAAVRQVVLDAGHQESMTVRLSPKDHKVLERLRSQLNPATSVRYVADDRVELGGCLVELDRGLLDGRIESQLKTLHEALYAAVAEARHG